MEPMVPERELSTVELIRRAVEESRLLVKAEILHAKREVREELSAALTSAVLAGVAVVFALSGLAVLFVMIAIALPTAEVAGCAIVGCILLIAAGICAYIGYRRVPKRPLERSRSALRADLTIARGHFH
jgi:uncharacterized membrane protein YqjE